jgi:monoamine oxidase
MRISYAVSFETAYSKTSSCHWAGTETSAKMYGFIDGAVRSGERTATEVIQREAMTVA